MSSPRAFIRAIVGASRLPRSGIARAVSTSHQTRSFFFAQGSALVQDHPSSVFRRSVLTSSRLFQAESVALPSKDPSPPSPSTAPANLAKPTTPNQPESSKRGDQLGQPSKQADDSSSQIDWTTSFHGLSDAPFPKEAANVLLNPVDPADVEIKPDGIIYLPEIKYRRILNQAFGPGGWGLAPRGESTVTAKTVTREYALLAHGRSVDSNWNGSKLQR